MKNFIPVVRTDRLREMQSYDAKSYSFLDRKQYRMLEKIDTLQEGYQFTFGVEVTQNDVYFYIIHDSANLYLSIEELYQLLVDMSADQGKDFVQNMLKKQLTIHIRTARKQQDPDGKKVVLNLEKFRYRNLQYDIRRTVVSNQDGKLTVPNVSLQITYHELWMLLNLIQEKSNALFARNVESKRYVDGIFRLFVVLLWLEKDHPLLQELGWQYDTQLGRFAFHEIPEKKKTPRGRRKYYLTKEEYKNILNIKES